ncbi:hypothetical protein [Pseudoalteromonas piscicida]|uniref:hypothetical protein n=1 Tax=Pseudoalteromonas piscicida TaxID=43662 RepID=UPI001C949AEB|nr:hypothetical protein [Pseudoalteromonas piscicida]QZO14771.1 hypothetical protein K5642_21055 [Pseudoalteromonas piscicida]
MQRINVLIVEDQQEHIEQWTLALSDFNINAKKHGKNMEFSYQFATTYAEAKSHLNTYNFSAAIVDIRLAEENGESNENNTKGNDVLLDIVNSTMCLAWVYTGQQIDADIPDHLVEYIELIDRSAKGKSEVLEDLAEKRDMLKSIMEIKNTFSLSKAEHFYSAIWPRWNLWSIGDNEYKEKAIVRHMATHLHASFLNETNKVHPEEYYFTGHMIKGKLETGDITLVDGKHYILVTPRCEIAQKKNSYFQFVELEDKSKALKEESEKLSELRADLEKKNALNKICTDKNNQLINEYNTAVNNTNTLKEKARNTLKNKGGVEGDNLVNHNKAIGDDLLQLLELLNEEKDAKVAKDKAEEELKQSEQELIRVQKKIQKQESAINKILPNNGVKVSIHILPEIRQLDGKTFGPLHARFEQITYIDKNDAATVKHYENGRYARLSNEFVPSFVERLGSHFSRIGTPDYSHPG